MKNFEFNAGAWSDIDDIASELVGNAVDDAHEEVLRDVPRDTGNLASTVEKDYAPGSQEGYVSVGTDYWAAVEYGTPAHTIRRSTEEVLTDGTVFYGKEVNHPGTEAQPFLRPAAFKKRQLRRDS